jgi:hypothetical protein
MNPGITAGVFRSESTRASRSFFGSTSQHLRRADAAAVSAIASGSHVSTIGAINLKPRQTAL